MLDRLTFYFVCGIHQLQARAERHAQEIAKEILNHINPPVPTGKSIVVLHTPGDCENFAKKLIANLQKDLPADITLLCETAPWGDDRHVIGFLLSSVLMRRPFVKRIRPAPIVVVFVQNRLGTDQWATAYGGTSPFSADSGTFFVATWPNGINRKQLEEDPRKSPRAH